MRTYQPIGDRILVRRREKKTTASGLHLPDRRDGDHEPFEAEVLAVGPGKFEAFMANTDYRLPPVPVKTADGWTDIEDARSDFEKSLVTPSYVPMQVRPGQLVVIGKYSGTTIESDQLGERLLIVREDEILAIVTGGN